VPETRGQPPLPAADPSLEFTPGFREALRRGLRPEAAYVAVQAPIYVEAGYYLIVAPLAFMAARQKDTDTVAVINARLRMNGFRGVLPDPAEYDEPDVDYQPWPQSPTHPYRHPLDPPSPKPRLRAANPWSEDFERVEPDQPREDLEPSAPQPRELEPTPTKKPRKDAEALRDPSEHAATRWSAAHDLPKHRRQRPSQTYKGRRERYLRAKALKLGVSINSVRQTTAKRGPRQKEQ
jgi:hypothetical protein